MLSRTLADQSIKIAVEEAVDQAIEKAVAEALEKEGQRQAELAIKSTAADKPKSLDDFLKSLKGDAHSVGPAPTTGAPHPTATPAPKLLTEAAPARKAQAKSKASAKAPTVTEGAAPRQPGRPKKLLSLDEMDYGEQCRLRGEVIETSDPELAHLPARPLKLPVNILDSIKQDHLICLEDGRPYLMLARSLKSKCGMTPDQYRSRWGLPADYPMVSLAYSLKKHKNALDQGLGHHRKK